MEQCHFEVLIQKKKKKVAVQGQRSKLAFKVISIP
jgi:hypothetical protein